MNKIKIAAIVGPTASGKSALAVMLAKKYRGEVVSCDSMQIYCGLDIGTAKPTESEKCGISHHMIDIADQSVSFSCADFTAAAHKVIAEIAERGKLPILCGGTGLYIDNIIYDTAFPEVGADEEYRNSLSELSNEELHAKLSVADPKSAMQIHPNNRKRVIRALEIYHLTGIAKSEWDKRSHTSESRYDATVIGLFCSDRNYLYSRIDKRVDEMLGCGLLDEVKRVNFANSPTASQAIGYKELKEYLDGKCSLDEAVSNLKQATRNYAKRQLTWFSRNENIQRIDISGKTAGEIFAEAEKSLNSI